MRTFATVFFRAKPKEPLAERVRRVLHVVGEPGRGSRRVLFFLRDNPFKKTSAIARVVKAQPEAAAFVYRGPVSREMQHYPAFDAISNFAPPWTEHNPHAPGASLPVATLLAILDGFPRRFPFGDAAITVDGIDWNGDGFGLDRGPAADDQPPAPGFGRYLFPSVTLPEDTRVDFQAIVELPPSDLRIGDRARAKLAAMGRVSDERIRVRREGEDLRRSLERRERAMAFVESFNARLRDWLATTVRLPADRPPAERPPAMGSGADEPFSVKPPLVAAFRPLGYEYVAVQSGGGMYELVKQTPAHHRLRVGVDRGTWSRRLSGMFSFHAIEANHAVVLPAFPAQSVNEYPIDSQATVDAIVANWAAMVPALERDFAGPLAEIYGADPDWA